MTLLKVIILMTMIMNVAVVHSQPVSIRQGTTIITTPQSDDVSAQPQEAYASIMKRSAGAGKLNKDRVGVEDTQDDATSSASNAILIKDDISQVETNLQAVVAAVQHEDEAKDKIKKLEPYAGQLLQMLSDEKDPAHPSNPYLLSSFVNTVKEIAIAVVEQNDDGKLHKLLQILAQSVRKLVQDISPNAGTGNDGIDLAGLDLAVEDQQTV